MMNAPTPSTIQQLRERDGDNCWLCNGKLSFTAPPNSKKAPTKEHLVALALGGTNRLDNLVLCHPTCNRQLGMRPMSDKLKMREQQIANRAKQAGLAKPLVKAAPVQAATAKVTPPQQSVLPAAAPAPSQRIRTPSTSAMPAPDWQRIAMIATASSTFFAGLCLGMLIE